MRSLDPSAVEPMPCSAPNPRGDGAGFMICSEVGYAIFAGGKGAIGDADESGGDAHAVFRCCACQHSGHCHCDALSFVIYGLGRDWLVDCGKMNNDAGTPIRRYMKSRRAHKFVLINNRTHGWQPTRVVGWGRDARCDFAVAEIELDRVKHTRTFAFLPPLNFEITDRFEIEGERGGGRCSCSRSPPGCPSTSGPSARWCWRTAAAASASCDRSGQAATGRR